MLLFIVSSLSDPQQVLSNYSLKMRQSVSQAIFFLNWNITIHTATAQKENLLWKNVNCGHLVFFFNFMHYEGTLLRWLHWPICRSWKGEPFSGSFKEFDKYKLSLVMEISKDLQEQWVAIKCSLGIVRNLISLVQNLNHEVLLWGACM